MRIGRRQLGLGVGLSLLLGPALAGLEPRARAASPKVASRVIFFFSPNGTVHRHWRPQGTGAEFTFAPGSILEPLTKHQKDVVVVSGVDFKGFDNHDPGMRGMLTGMPGAGIFGGASVDQHVAKAIGEGTRFPSLELGVATSAWGSGGQTRMAYSPGNKIVDPEDSPFEAFKRLFGDALESKDAQAAARLVLRRKSILDAVRGDLGDLKYRLGAAEKAKVDEHLEALRKVEKGLAGGGSCAAPEAPLQIDHRAMASVPAVGKAQTDLLVMALACGMTKVASLQWSHTVSPLLMSWLGLGEAHHELSHKDDSNTQGVADFVKAERWFAEQFAYLLDKLAATPDPAGGTLLDTSLVVWTKELGDSRQHDAKSVPFVLAGRANGALPTGRHLDFGGVSHHALLSSLCEATGAPAPTAGLPGLLGGA